MSSPSPVPKLAHDAARHARHFRPYADGRSAFKAILQSLDWANGRRLLLPAYIGWSAREGSGIHDPVRELSLAHAFYRVGPRLDIDLSDLRERLAAAPRAVLLVVHYFGRVDPGYQSVIELARAAGAEVIEDEAHAMLSDLVGGVCGRAGEHAFFAIHKLLPAMGGAWARRGGAPIDAPAVPALLSYDLPLIAAARRANHARLTELLARHRVPVDALWPVLAPGQVPQSYPLLLPRRQGGRALRDEVYARMNARGLGVVSLYHTLIPALTAGEFPDSVSVSESILNLPVHQDLSGEQLEAVVTGLRDVLGELAPEGG